MSFPEPEVGLVIRYAYLWAREHDAGREEAAKDRPAAILLATRDREGERQVVVLPIMHVTPFDPETAIPIPGGVKKRLRLDDDQSWIVANECNVFAWPGPDLRFARGAGPESIAYGFLPERLFEIVRDRFVLLDAKAKVRMVRRSE